MEEEREVVTYGSQFLSGRRVYGKNGQEKDFKKAVFLFTGI